MGNYLTVIITALIIILIAKFLFHFTGKNLIRLILNAVIGFIVLWIINWTGLITIPLNFITSLLAGALGLPGVILLIILVLVGVI